MGATRVYRMVVRFECGTSNECDVDFRSCWECQRAFVGNAVRVD
jgi:hypothetical protein